MSSHAGPTIWWLRRDFRLADNPALGAAVDAGEAVLALFVLDPVLLASAGAVRRSYLHACLRGLDADLKAAGGPGLSVRKGRPEQVVPHTAQAVAAKQVHISADFGPYGRRRDDRVAQACKAAGVQLVATGSPYAVAPGTLRTQSRHPFRVFTPFYRAWQDHGVPGPAPALAGAAVTWTEAPSRVALPESDPELTSQACERAARQHWHAYLRNGEDGVDGYDHHHDLPGADATSRLSVALRWGLIHPRTVLHDLRQHGADNQRSQGRAQLARQIAWRDFFADALFHRPEAVLEPIRPEFAAMPSEDPQTSPEARRRLAAWQRGRTGFPMVDAGMRQLLAEGYMHNRARLLTASFLIKDLHIGWWHGAAWFMARLRDGDIAQNQMNWQWVAGSGLDAAPYFRVFNPVTQGEKFDADGRYVRRWVPELADLATRWIQTPWEAPDGLPPGYPERIVDHATERKEALERYGLVKSQERR